MIKYVKGNILESDAEALVNPVNCVGVMGAGLAKQFKTKYPEMFDKYKELCKQGKFHGGHIHIYQIKGKRRFIINFATKVHWKDKAKLDYIKFGLGTLADFLKYTPLIKSIAIPALGCGCGVLNWQDVKEIMEDYLSDINCDIRIYVPNNKKESV